MLFDYKIYRQYREQYELALTEIGCRWDDLLRFVWCKIGIFWTGKIMHQNALVDMAPRTFYNTDPRVLEWERVFFHFSSEELENKKT